MRKSGLYKFVIHDHKVCQTGIQFKPVYKDSAMRFCLLIMCLFAFSVSAEVSDPIKKAMEAPAKVGEARFSRYFWDIYDATLYAPDGKWQNKPPFALTLVYLRDIEGKQIAKHSIKEMKKQGLDDEQKSQRWQTQMQDIFPDISNNDVLTGIATKNNSTQFFYNGEAIGTIEDTDFTQRFFDIWLGENTSEPEFREQLLKKAKS